MHLQNVTGVKDPTRFENTQPTASADFGNRTASQKESDKKSEVDKYGQELIDGLEIEVGDANEFVYTKEMLVEAKENNLMDARK